VRRAPGDSRRLYAFGRFVYRSDDDGRNWENLTEFRQTSLVGEGLKDLAIAPRNPDEVTVVGAAGVFRSTDGGLVWHGMNENLPNLPASRILSAPGDGHGPQIVTGGKAYEWLPGELRAWEPVLNSVYEEETARRQEAASTFGSDVTAFAQSASGYRYYGDATGIIRVTFPGGTSVSGPEVRGRVNAIWVDPQDARLAIAALGSGALWHTVNGGGLWVAITSDLPAGSLNAIAVDRAGNTIYVAGEAGVFQASYRVDALGGLPQWSQVNGLPTGRVTGIAMDPAKTQLWVALEGAGLYRTVAPHRVQNPLVVTAADRRVGEIAPGTQVSVVGMPVTSAKANGVDAPVLSATDVESQIQIPYEVSGASVSLSVTSAEGSREFPGLTLRSAVPAIFEIDGTPLLEDAEHGTPLDTTYPGRSHMKVRILAQGLGRVREDTREAIEPVLAFFQRRPVTVERAVLAPGYSGVYWIEIELPVLMESGMEELYLQVGGQESNHVRFYVESILN
jgi:uncharacterized protein (TIGR03437 family)